MGTLSTPPLLRETGPSAPRGRTPSLVLAGSSRSARPPCICPAGGLPRGRSGVFLAEDRSEVKDCSWPGGRDSGGSVKGTGAQAANKREMGLH